MKGATFELEHSSYLSSLLGYLSVGATLSLANPIEFVRIRMQTMQELLKQGRLKKPYRNLPDCFERVVKEEGTRAFWKGNCSNLLKFFPAETLNWTMKSFFEHRLKELNETHSPSGEFFNNYFGGALAGLTTRTLLYPLEFSKNKMNNIIAKSKKGIVGHLAEAFRKEGLRGIYRGAAVSLVGVTIFRSTYFGIYDTFKDQTNDGLDRWLVSYMATLAAIGITYPSDTARRRLMMTSGASYKYRGFLDCCKKIWRREGLRGFYAGGPVIFIQSASGATVYFIIDKIMKNMGVA
jgi:solute carrier family 25 (mitochondrial adenine nucleotide translocator), member 4/5/6/31